MGDLERLNDLGAELMTGRLNCLLHIFDCLFLSSMLLSDTELALVCLVFLLYSLSGIFFGDLGD
jgi:hypothetical protein